MPPSSAIGSFIIGSSPIGGAAAGDLATSPTTLTDIIPSYLYVQYNDDDNLQAFVAAYNTLAQQYLDWFNSINLPIYTSSSIAGSLLDWVAAGIYGLYRQTLQSGKSQILGPYNTNVFNSLPYNTQKTIGSINYFQTDDDTFKRIITWSFYKGDGFQFSIKWLKRRLQRFLNGVAGTDQGTDQTYPVSVSFAPGNNVTIDLTAASSNPVAAILQEGLQSGAIPLPFQYTYTITI